MYNASFNLRHYGENMFEKRQVMTVFKKKATTWFTLRVFV